MFKLALSCCNLAKVTIDVCRHNAALGVGGPANAQIAVLGNISRAILACGLWKDVLEARRHFVTLWRSWDDKMLYGSPCFER